LFHKFCETPVAHATTGCVLPTTQKRLIVDFVSSRYYYSQNQQSTNFGDHGVPNGSGAVALGRYGGVKFNDIYVRTFRNNKKRTITPIEAMVYSL